jgi:hypothetical protein
MKERFEDSKIGVAQFCLLNALLGVRPQRLESLHEDEPEMNAAAILPVGLFFHKNIC